MITAFWEIGATKERGFLAFFDDEVATAFGARLHEILLIVSDWLFLHDLLAFGVSRIGAGREVRAADEGLAAARLLKDERRSAFGAKLTGRLLLLFLNEFAFGEPRAADEGRAGFAVL